MSYRWPVNRLRIKDPIAAGMNPYVLLGMVPLLRNTAQDHPPIQVARVCPTCGTGTAMDGRHRWFANVLAGRPDVLAEDDSGEAHV